MAASSSSSSSRALPPIPLLVNAREADEDQDQGGSSSATYSDTSTAYRLLELPNEIAALLEKQVQLAKDDAAAAAVAAESKKRKHPSSVSDDNHDDDDDDSEDAQASKRGRIVLTINGRFADDAVVCTADRTYALRDVAQSNSLMLCSLQRAPPPSSSLASASASAAVAGDVEREREGAQRRVSGESAGSHDSGLVLVERSLSTCTSTSGSTAPAAPASAPAPAPGTASGPASAQAQGQGQGQGPPAEAQVAILNLRCTVGNTLELQWTRPHLERIPSMLRPTAFAGWEEERRKVRLGLLPSPSASPYTSASASGSKDGKTGPAGPRFYTMKEVRSVVQASPAELQRGLDAYRVIKLRRSSSSTSPRDPAHESTAGARKSSGKGKEGKGKEPKQRRRHARMVDASYLTHVLKQLLSIVDMHAWRTDAVPESELLEALVALGRQTGPGEKGEGAEEKEEEEEEGDVPRELAQAVLRRWFGKRKREEAGAGGTQEDDEEEAESSDSDVEAADLSSATHKASKASHATSKPKGKGKGKAREHDIVLDLPAIARHIGLQLLASLAPKRDGEPSTCRLDEFLELWREEVGESVEGACELSLLAGEYLVLTGAGTGGKKIQHFPSATLPLDPAARFQELFLTRAQWTLQELLPFVEPLAVDRNKRDALLLKYCRTSQVKVPAANASTTTTTGRGGAQTQQKMETVTMYSSRLRY